MTIFENHDAWRAALKPGDKVAIDIGSHSVHWTIKTVGRVTKLHVVTTDESKYRIRGGCEVNSNRFAEIQPVTDEIRASIHDKRRRYTAMEAITGVLWREQSTETLEAVALALREGGK